MCTQSLVHECRRTRCGRVVDLMHVMIKPSRSREVEKTRAAVINRSNSRFLNVIIFCFLSSLTVNWISLRTTFWCHFLTNESVTWGNNQQITNKHAPLSSALIQMFAAHTRVIYMYRHKVFIHDGTGRIRSDAFLLAAGNIYCLLDRHRLPRRSEPRFCCPTLRHEPG